MKLFTFYKRRIQNRIYELLAEQQMLINERGELKQSLTPQKWASYSVKLGNLQMKIDELTKLLK